MADRKFSGSLLKTDESGNYILSDDVNADTGELIQDNFLGRSYVAPTVASLSLISGTPPAGWSSGQWSAKIASYQATMSPGSVYLALRRIISSGVSAF